MTIQTISLDQQQQYQQQHTSKRTITRLNVANTHRSATQATSLTKQAMSVNANFLAVSKLNSVHINVEDNMFNEPAAEDIYQRPLPAKVKLIKLILESYFGKNLDISNKQFDYEKASAQVRQTQQSLAVEQLSSAQNSELISLDDKQYSQQEQLSVSTISSEQQDLNFTMQGEFIIDNQKVNLNYQLNLTSQYTSMSKITTTAAALKDPLVIQFGARSIGHINDYTKIDINRDNQLNNLPLFSGDVGYLVFDKNQNNKVDDGSELFGPTSNNGFAELAQLDSNNNGFFDNQDDKFSQVYIWQPKQTKTNSNEHGHKKESPSEQNLVSLSQAGIKAISLNAIATQFNFRDQSKGNTGEINAQLTQTSFAITENNQALGVHQINVRL